MRSSKLSCLCMFCTRQWLVSRVDDNKNALQYFFPQDSSRTFSDQHTFWICALIIKACCEFCPLRVAQVAGQLWDYATVVYNLSFPGFDSKLGLRASRAACFIWNIAWRCECQKKKHSLSSNYTYWQQIWHFSGYKKTQKVHLMVLHCWCAIGRENTSNKSLYNIYTTACLKLVAHPQVKLQLLKNKSCIVLAV